MSRTSFIIKSIAAVAILVIATIISALSVMVTPAAASLPNLQPTIATSSVSVAGPQENRTLFAARTNCSSRNITTSSSSIMISFDSTLLTPSASRGHWQAASTTVAYDAEQWGCANVTAFGIASTSVTLTETAF